MLMFLFSLLSCSQQVAKSKVSFNEIRALVTGKTAVEVESLLGKPDSRQPMSFAAERWIWWNYTYLDGANYPPEMRGQVVHLEIIFERDAGPAPSGSKPALSDLKATDPLFVSYMIPQEQI